MGDDAERARITDRLGRPVEDLRISVTDRCNLRCRYCMPREVFGADYPFVDRSEVLTFEELTRVARCSARLGVRKLRLTGGEPLLRRGLPELVAALAEIDGIDDLALTTNAVRLADHAGELAGAGLGRVTVSLDALDDEVFRAISDTRTSVRAVTDGIDAAVAAGLTPVKVNTVLQRGVNDGELEPLARWARHTGVTLRFIEFMDVGVTNGWRREQVVPAAEVLERLAAVSPIEPLDTDGSAVAERYRYLDGGGEVGVVASVTRPFCRSCVRARLSAVGELYTCLFAAEGHDLRGLVRAGATDDEVTELLASVWGQRSDRASELRAEAGLAGPRVEMSYIGG